MLSSGHTQSAYTTTTTTTTTTTSVNGAQSIIWRFQFRRRLVISRGRDGRAPCSATPEKRAKKILEETGANTAIRRGLVRTEPVSGTSCPPGARAERSVGRCGSSIDYVQITSANQIFKVEMWIPLERLTSARTAPTCLCARGCFEMLLASSSTASRPTQFCDIMAQSQSRHCAASVFLLDICSKYTS